MTGILMAWTSYALLAVFVVAFLAKAIRLARLPVHLRWELAPVPHEKGRGRYGGSFLEEFEWWTKPRERSLVSELVYMFQEIVFLKSVYEHNRPVWWFSFPFHSGLYLLIVSAPLLAAGELLRSFGSLPVLSSTLLQVVPVLAGLGFVLGCVGGAGLLVLRLTTKKMREATTPAALLNLTMVLAVFASGAYAFWASPDFAAGMVDAVKALLGAAVPTSAALTAHLLIAFVFLAFLPFTPMMHFVAKYFTYHQVRWDDEPMAAGSAMESEVKQLLGQAVGWSGRHLGADGKKNWVDIATGDGKNG